MGQGSEFVVSLSTTEPVPQAAPEPQHPRNGAPAKRRVLVVDDTRAAAFLLGKLLEALGQDVEICYDAATAVEAARRSRPDMVLSDIAMPHMDGYQLARQLRSDEALNDVTLVALTGHGQESDRRRAQEAGFHQHLVKPVSLATLQKLLDG